MQTLPAINNLLRAFAILVCSNNLSIADDSLPPASSGGGIVIYQSFENANFSFRIEPDYQAEYTVWSNGRIRERYHGLLTKKAYAEFLQRLNELPPSPQTPNKSKRSFQENREMESDSFMLLFSQKSIRGRLRNSPSSFASILQIAKRTGADLTRQSTDGIYFFAEYSSDNSRDNIDQDLKPPASKQEQDALVKALQFPYSPILVSASNSKNSEELRPGVSPPSPAFRITLLYGHNFD